MVLFRRFVLFNMQKTKIGEIRRSINYINYMLYQKLALLSLETVWPLDLT